MIDLKAGYFARPMAANRTQVRHSSNQCQVPQQRMFVVQPEHYVEPKPAMSSNIVLPRSVHRQCLLMQLL